MEVIFYNAALVLTVKLEADLWERHFTRKLVHILYIIEAGFAKYVSFKFFKKINFYVITIAP